MSEENLLEIISLNKKNGYIVAPAGYGKTHLIALATRQINNHQLILTHTFAGVNALKKKMRDNGVSPTMYTIDTIASWTLRLCLAYKENSNWDIESPSSKQWQKLYESCLCILEKNFGKRIIRSSYSGMFVDEYQDCSIVQHKLILKLSNIIPCIILGDPLQSIFDFNDKPVNWEGDVCSNFSCLGELDTPWRWKNANKIILGRWLYDIRKPLSSGNSINIIKQKPVEISIHNCDLDDFSSVKHINLLMNLASKYTRESIAVIFPGSQLFKTKSHKLARKLRGIYSSIEEVESTVFYSYINKISKSTDSKKMLEITIQFAEKCMTNVNSILSAGTKRFEISDTRLTTKYPELTIAANDILTCPSSTNQKKFLLLLKENKETVLFRKDLFYRIIQTLNLHSTNTDISIVDAANIFQRRFRHTGRLITHRIIGTTLLLKGLEFDHVVILYAESLSHKELYVALTRACKSISVITNQTYLPMTG